ncbi:TonB-dependent receptor [Bacteroidales bacterium OttesenSCG-928-C19]|nr:TonB-dependent receptor [Bacteroidales bacterium OttesenSCG-928-C19]
MKNICLCKKIWVGLVLWVLGCVPMNLFSQDSLEVSGSIREIGEVVISANRYKEVIPSQRFAGEELQRLNSHSVADAIRYFSGVQIKDYGGVGGLKTVDVRSMGTHHMGVFYDGIQLGNAQNGQIDLGKFSLDNIDEVSLYNGQKSEIFQPAKDFGSAGTIYLRTRKPRFEDGKKTNLRCVFRTGSFDLLNPSILWEQKIKNNISSSLNAEYTYSSGKYKFRYKKYAPDGTLVYDTTAIRKNGDINAFRAEAGLNGFFETGTWNVKAYFYNSERGIPGAIVSNVWQRPERQWDRNFFAQASLQKNFGNKYEMQLNAKYANDYMHYLSKDLIPYTDTSDALKSLYIDNQFWQDELYFSFANKYSILPQWDVALSADYQWNTLDADLKDFVDPKRHTLLASLATAFEWNRFKAQASLLGTFVLENVTRIQRNEDGLLPGAQTGTPSDKQEYTPAFFLSYKPFSKYNLNVRAFYKRIFRMPTFNDLYYTDIGNIALNPEYTNQYNLGIQYTKPFKETVFKSLTLRADAYYNEITDKIVAVPKGSGQYRWMMINLGYVEIRGIDVSTKVACELPGNIQFESVLNYTYQKAQDFTDPTSKTEYGGQIPYIPWHNGSAILRATYRSWELNYSFIYVGERYHNSANIRENYEPSWYTHDLSFGKVFRWKKCAFKVTAEINNILNQQYDVVLNYPMPGRNYKIILKLDI